MVNLGRFEGPYRYDPTWDAHYPNCRSVRWLRHLPRDHFTQAALYEIGSFITLFQIRNHQAEFRSALGDHPPIELLTEPDSDDEAVTQTVSVRAEETTSDFVIRQLKSGLDPYQFEQFIAHLLRCIGYHARVTQKSGDGGVDIIAHKDELGFEPPIIKVHCKQVTTSIGRPEVAQPIGHTEQGEHALFVCLGSYTRECREYDRAKSNLRLLDGEQLVDLIFQHYEKFDPRYQSLLPLKRIYVPALDH